MPDRMWPLSWLRIDEATDANDVYLFDPDEGEMILLSRAEAITRAHSSGLHLIAWWPMAPGDSTPSCILGRVAVPPRWEQAPTDPAPVDEELWFEGTCGGRDFLLDGSGHTFRGRMTVDAGVIP